MAESKSKSVFGDWSSQENLPEAKPDLDSDSTAVSSAASLLGEWVSQDQIRGVPTHTSSSTLKPPSPKAGERRGGVLGAFDSVDPNAVVEPTPPGQSDQKTAFSPPPNTARGFEEATMVDTADVHRALKSSGSLAPRSAGQMTASSALRGTVPPALNSSERMAHFAETKSSVPFRVSGEQLRILGYATTSIVFLLLCFWGIGYMLTPPTIEELVAGGDLSRAIQQLKKEGRWLEAAGYLRQQKRSKEALEAYLKAKAYSQAAMFLYAQKQYMEAGKYFAQSRAYDRAANAYRRAKKPLLAAKMLQHNHRLEEALRVLREAKMYRAMVPIYLSLGQHTKAAWMFLHMGKFAQAAHIFRKKQMWLQALKAYLRAQNWFSAGQMALTLQQHQQAARLFRKAEILRCVGVAYQLAQKHRASGRAFERAAEGEKSFALLLQAAAGYANAQRKRQTRAMLKKALTLAEQYRDPIALLNAFRRMGKPKKAYRILRRWQKDYEKRNDFASSLALTGVALQIDGLSWGQRKQMERKMRKLQALAVQRPHLISATYKSQKHKNKASSAYVLTFSAGAVIPVRFRAIPEMTLSCTAFEKDATKFARSVGDDPSAEMCSRFLGVKSQFLRFEQAPVGQRLVVHHKTKTLLKQGKVSFSKIFAAPYKRVRCVLGPKEGKE